LAFLPIEEVLDCAYEIQESFKEVLSPKASMSAGVVIAYHKYPLYLALEEVRAVEKNAKNKYGKNAFCVKLLKHSGEQREFGCKWSEIDFIKEIVCKFKMGKIPSRFAYDFADVVNEVGESNREILNIELRRICLRKLKDNAIEGEFIEKIAEKFNDMVERYSIYDFVNMFLISKFIADGSRI